MLVHFTYPPPIITNGIGHAQVYLYYLRIGFGPQNYSPDHARRVARIRIFGKGKDEVRHHKPGKAGIDEINQAYDEAPDFALGFGDQKQGAAVIELAMALYRSRTQLLGQNVVEGREVGVDAALMRLGADIGNSRYIYKTCGADAHRRSLSVTFPPKPSPP